jgi:hypothetical protein
MKQKVVPAALSPATGTTLMGDSRGGFARG